MYTLWWWHEYWRHRDSRSGKIDRSCRSTAQPAPLAAASPAGAAWRRHAGLQRAPAALSHTRDTARSPATIVTVTHAKSSSHLRHLRQTIVAALLLMLPLLPACLGQLYWEPPPPRLTPRPTGLTARRARPPGHRVFQLMLPLYYLL